MWTYTPKINRVIKVPSSMMNQNWMGSDFSNKDISKNTDIIDQYDHTLLEQRQQDSHTVYVIESIPHEEAAVVWGKEILVIRDDWIMLEQQFWDQIRDDWIMLEQQFWDQDGKLVKRLASSKIEQMSGRSVATVIRMSKADAADEWTELQTAEVEFDLELPGNLFTLSSLRNPRQ
jgi:outer membrane lipoprotein-sorting protein